MLVSSAMMYHSVSVDLLASSTPTKILESSRAGNKTDAFKLFGYAISGAVLSALAAELMLKGLIAAERNEPPTSGKAAHDLLRLFDKLSCPLRETIELHAKQRGFATTVRNILKDHRDNFTTVRYWTAELSSDSPGWQINPLLPQCVQLMRELYPTISGSAVE